MLSMNWVFMFMSIVIVLFSSVLSSAEAPKLCGLDAGEARSYARVPICGPYSSTTEHWVVDH